MSKIYKTFDDLVFTEHSIATAAKQLKQKIDAGEIKRSRQLDEMIESQTGAKQAYINFDNKRGLSVLFGDCFYSDGFSTYECTEKHSDEPEGYMTREQVTEFMKVIQDKPEYSDEEQY